jgi:lipopolysaccharide cholinephosphotransferase
MGIKDKIMRKFLNKSNSYNFYKEYYEKMGGNENFDANIELQKLKEDFEDYKKKTDRNIKSYNDLFNTLFLDLEWEANEVLLDMQILLNELIDFIGTVAKRNDLKWWIDYGTLLGAVRHGTYVPWDDDSDVGMLRKDYLKFCEVIQDEINHFGLDDIVTVGFRERKIDDNTIDSFIRLFIYDKNKQGRRIIISGVDIFPYDYLNNYDEDKLDEIYYQAKLKYFRNLAKKMDPMEALDIMYEDINLNMDGAKYVIPGVEGAHGIKNLYKLKVLESDKMFPLSEVKLLNKTFPAPGDTDYHLYNIYRIYN